jgi:hypothetical protein
MKHILDSNRGDMEDLGVNGLTDSLDSEERKKEKNK